jgi:hypothetical protein
VVTVTNSARNAPRRNMFVMAALSGDEFSEPVKVRNLSSTGALIEGTVLPKVGARVTLRRGNSTACGVIVWCIGGKAGLKVDGHLEVADWMPGDHTHKNGIDSVIAKVSEERAVGLIAPALERSVAVNAIELRSLADAIGTLADDLSDDKQVVVRFASKLQTLDIAVQVLRKLAAAR